MIEVNDYIDRVVGYVQKIHGEEGLKRMEGNFEVFKEYAKEYNEKYEEFVYKIISLPSYQQEEIRKEVARDVYKKIKASV